MKKKILIVLFGIKKAQEHEWFVEMINNTLFQIEFVLINSMNSYMDKFLQNHNMKTYHFNYSGKSNLPSLTWNLFKLIKKNKYDVVHTHLFEANIAGMTAAFLASVPKRVITRHHSDFHHVYFPSAVKYDKYVNRIATDIVAISKNVENVLINLEHANPDKIRLIHHGIDMADYLPGSVKEDRVSAVKLKYNIKSDDGPVVGAISRFIELKGLQYLIPAFKKLLEIYPKAVLVLANASGSYSPEIAKLLALLDERNYRLIVFENDIAALYKVFDCFVHIPITNSVEAFGQIYLEALASKVPSVFTMSGVAPEFVIDKVNGLVVPFKDSEAVFNALLFIIQNKGHLESMLNKGYEIVKEKFDIRFKIEKLENLYSS